MSGPRHSTLDMLLAGGGLFCCVMGALVAMKGIPYLMEGDMWFGGGALISAFNELAIGTILLVLRDIRGRLG